MSLDSDSLVIEDIECDLCGKRDFDNLVSWCPLPLGRSVDFCFPCARALGVLVDPDDTFPAYSVNVAKLVGLLVNLLRVYRQQMRT
jgi:hypothetical protein